MKNHTPSDGSAYPYFERQGIRACRSGPGTFLLGHAVRSGYGRPEVRSRCGGGLWRFDGAFPVGTDGEGSDARRHYVGNPRRYGIYARTEKTGRTSVCRRRHCRRACRCHWHPGSRPTEDVPFTGFTVRLSSAVTISCPRICASTGILP